MTRLQLLRAKLAALAAYHAGQVTWQEYRATEAHLDNLLRQTP